MQLKKGLLYIVAVGFCGCVSSQPQTYTSPKGYDLTAPETFSMPDNLVEISGIAFYQGNPDVIFAEQDEKGKLYWLALTDRKAKQVTFGKNGDYEDLAITDRQVIMLRSDGTLFTFPFVQKGAYDEKVLQGKVKKWKDLLDKGEYEGLYADAAANKLYVLCKNCQVDHRLPQLSGYILSMIEGASKGDVSGQTPAASVVSDIQLASTFSIDTRQIQAQLDGAGKAAIGKQKKDDKVAGIRFKPSALTWDARTKQWFVLSSINKMLVVTDANWQVQQVHILKPALFPQPEGITFDKEGNLYISNEGGSHKGTVLKFAFRP